MEGKVLLEGNEAVSRMPSSKRLGQPSSVWRRRVSRRAKRLPQREHLWFRAFKWTCRAVSYGVIYS